MKRLILLCLLWAGCAQQPRFEAEPIALLYSAEEASKTDALSEGDEVTVCASVDGAGNYFLENSRWTVGSDGKALVPPQPVFYPDAKQAVSFWAYFGTQSVPSDQSTAAALKQADLCWASASSTPSHTAVPLTFSHVFARLAVTCSAPTSKILISSVFSGGTLDIRSGAFTNGTKSDVSTTGNELIVPAQTLHRLLVTSNGIDYVFDGSISLESGKTTTVNLTLNASTQTATLNGSSVSAWTASAQSGNLSEAVSNVLTLHWPNYVPQGATPDKVLLTINGSDYTVPSGISYANQTFTVPFASSTLRYPYTISKITFYNGSAQSLPACTQLLGAAVYKSGASTVGIKDIANAVMIDHGGIKLWWATGNLVRDGANGCKIGQPTDCGLYFAYCSLVGWSNGPNNDGTGFPTRTLDVRFSVKPAAYFGSTAYPGPYELIADMPTTDNVSTGIGDPCRYYLKGSWRCPTADETWIQVLNQKGTVAYTGIYFDNTTTPNAGGHTVWVTSPWDGLSVASGKLYLIGTSLLAPTINTWYTGDNGTWGVWYSEYKGSYSTTLNGFWGRRSSAPYYGSIAGWQARGYTGPIRCVTPVL